MPTQAYFESTVDAFVRRVSEEVAGYLVTRSEFDVDTAQRDAWVAEIAILQAALEGVDGALFLEFNVARIGSRIDAVLISAGAIFPIEFKVGATAFSRPDINQVWDYALDLKNFHSGSHGAPILPILVATEAKSSEASFQSPAGDDVYPPARANGDGLRALISAGLAASARFPRLDPGQWAASPYQPTPTIIEAAQALYSQHSVDAIARHDAGAMNLRVTSHRVEELIDIARNEKRKIVIFVTGVPGAGKTLVGLNVATKKRDESQPSHAVFLSGNGPLVAVLREALVRDEVDRLKARGERVRKGVAAQKVKAFIQNVHHFRDAGLQNELAPADHVVIFDEAQRAWNHAMTSDFMRRKKGRPGFTQSEPEFLISVLDRHIDWAVVICLVGGGQEINRGEAGISAWLDAIRAQFTSWEAYISPDLTDTEYAAGKAIESLSGRANVVQDRDLHLAVSMRSFRAENVSRFVKAVLDCDTREASGLLAEVTRRYPIVVTRDLNKAKQWVRDHARGSERYGLVASSEAERLKPHAIDIRYTVNPIHWFLNGADDTRSSYYLEDAATEFQVQGLELDWVCMTWDADLRFTGSDWSYHSFSGSKWKFMHKEDRKRFLLNAYRVLLTRARQGMAIFVPEGDVKDPTRSAKYYDPTYEYLADIGVRVLE
jgi:hypothetical protein